jgi:hypothetical protein
MSNECADKILCAPQASKTAVTLDQPTSPEKEELEEFPIVTCLT